MTGSPVGSTCLVALAFSFAAAAACGQEDAPCSRDFAVCSGACVSLYTDTHHCGACDQACRVGERCLDGECEMGCGAGVGVTLCDHECVDVRWDPRHCGGCFSACAESEDCLAGQCERCTYDGNRICEEQCIEIQNDASNCGDCGLACVDGSSCVDGVCACVLGELCEGRCRDTTTDESSCGACGAQCGPVQSCVAGECVCPPQFQACGGGGDCIDVRDDPANCGACGVSVPAGALCDDGYVLCPPTAIDCDGWPDRIDCRRRSDSAECGSCNDAAGCLDGSSCSPTGCAMEVTGLDLDCDGPHAAGAASTRCRAALRLAAGSTLDVSASTFLRWSEGACSGPTCMPPRNPDAPSIVAGGAGQSTAGTFRPAGGAHPGRVTSDVGLEARARFQLGTTDVEAVIVVRTVPRTPIP